MRVRVAQEAVVCAAAGYREASPTAKARPLREKEGERRKKREATYSTAKCSVCSRSRSA